MKCTRTACNNEAEDFVHVQLGGNYCRACVRGINSAHREWVLEHGSLFKLTKTLEQCCREQDHLFVMKHPELWTNHPPGSQFKVIHLKNKPWTVNSRFGVLVEDDGSRVYIKDMVGRISFEPVVYESFEAMIQDGWEID